jgi:hypothetical protein
MIGFCILLNDLARFQLSNELLPIRSKRISQDSHGRGFGSLQPSESRST